MVPWAHPSQPPNSILVSSAVFARHIHVIKTQTNRETDHVTCSICSYRPHLCNAYNYNTA